jgi:hypothetical protein
MNWRFLHQKRFFLAFSPKGGKCCFAASLFELFSACLNPIIVLICSVYVFLS